LEDCVKVFFSAEVLDHTCEWCKHDHCTLIKKITKHPTSLVLHLKRFSWKDGTPNSKISRNVEFKEKLTLVPNMNYRLVAVIQHIGSTCSSGHYIAHVVVDESWVTFDDQNWKQTSWERVKEVEAYMLFFKVCLARIFLRFSIDRRLMMHRLGPLVRTCLFSGFFHESLTP
jgi:ubiquitin C-terminal hydrolase